MPANYKRKQSKRMTCRKKYKIMKKVAEHRRKVRREQRKNPKNTKSKDPGVPNSLPFKEEILQEAEQRKQRAQAIKELQKANRLELQLKNRGIDEMIDVATKMDKKLEKVSIKQDTRPKEKVLDFKTASSDLKKLVEEADVILEILDARDPQGCRCPQLEELILKSGKKLILVLNKIDLVPRNNLEEWLQFLRQSLPTLALKASTPVPSTNPVKSKGKFNKNKLPSTDTLSQFVGGTLLMNTLAKYCSSLGERASIRVAVVGFPGVGKRSLINSLNKSSCPLDTSPMVQDKATEKRIRILDSPGVVLSSDCSPVVLALRNMVRVERLIDVLAPAEAIVERADPTHLCLHYTIPNFNSCEELLSLLAKRMGKFMKGGVPSVKEGAKRLINDWNRGVIKYYTRPPQVSEAKMALFDSEFQINPQEENTEFQKVQELFASKGVEVAASVPTDCASLATDYEEMDADCSTLSQEDEKDAGMEVENNEVKKKRKSKKCKKTRNQK